MLLRLDVDRLVAVDRVHDDREVQPRRIAAREPRVAVAAPLHRRADAVAVAEIDVVSHPDLVAVIENWGSRHREEQAVHQLDARAAVLHQRREAAADAEVEPHLRVGGILRVHVVALFVGHHLERQLVVVAQEDRPLAALGDLRRLVHDLDDGVTLLLAQAHEHARHEWKMERHVALVAIAEIRTDIRGPLIGLRQQHAPLIALVQLPPDRLEHVVRFGQVLVDRPFAFDQVGNGVQTQRIDAHIEPEAHRVDDRPEDLRILEIQVRLMREEPVPVVLLRHRVPAPVRFLRVDEDDAGAGVLVVGIAPDVEVALGGPLRRAARALEPRVLVGGVIDDQLREDADVMRVRGIDELLEMIQRAVDGIDGRIVGDVVAVVTQRRRVERQQPDAGDAQIVQVGDLLRQPGEVADAVVVAVVEGADVRLVDDRVLVPKLIGGHRHS
jgi:hypothetical protein